MTLLAHFDAHGKVLNAWHHPEAIAGQVAALAAALPGLAYARWPAPTAFDDGIDPQEAYRSQIAALGHHHTIKAIDRVHLTPDHPERERLRAQFLAEHTHADFEMRFFVSGRGLFYIRHADQVFGLLCTQGDWIALPAGTPHWFDTGAAPDFDALRFFTRPEGWVGDPTGGDTTPFPLIETFAAKVLG